MSGEEFLKFNNGKQFSFSNFKEIKESDLQGADEKTKKLFNIFAGDDKVLQADEAASLWDRLKSAAGTNKRGDKSVFDEEEIRGFLSSDEELKASSGESAFGVETLTNLLSRLFTAPKPPTQSTEPTSLETREYTPEEVKDISVQTLSDDVISARRLYNSQNNEQGGVSEFVNSTKETFDTEYASSRVGRYIRTEELGVALLTKSKSADGLTEKEYLEAKIDFVLSLIEDLEQYSLRTEITQTAINISLKSLTFGIAGDRKTKNSKELEEQKTELAYLKSILEKLSPEEINYMITQLLSIEENPETSSEYNISFDGKTNTAKPQTVTRGGVENQSLSFSPQEYEAQASVGSLASLSEAEAYRKMSFEEVFQTERGVEYDSAAVTDYAQKDSYMQFLLGVHNRREQVSDMLKEAKFIKQTRAYGSEQMPGEIQNNARKLMSQLTIALKTVYGNDAGKIQTFIDSVYSNSGNSFLPDKKPEVITDENGGFVRLNFGLEGEATTLQTADGKEVSVSLPGLNVKVDELTINSMLRIADELQSNIDDTYRQALNGKTIEEYGEEVKLAYAKAYGSGDSEAIANAYIRSQQEGVGYVKTGVTTVGMVVMVAGQLVPVGGQAAAALIAGGLATATLGSSAVTATELLTKEGKVTEEEVRELAKEVATSLALTATGMKIGKISEGVYLAVAKHCPKLVALAAEIGSDATMSLVADLVITGQIDLSGEGIAQLQNILTGIILSKGNFKTYLDTHAGVNRVLQTESEPPNGTHSGVNSSSQPGIEPPDVTQTGVNRALQTESETSDVANAGVNRTSQPEAETQKASGGNFKIIDDVINEGANGILSLSDKSGKVVGTVNYDVRELNGQKVLHFEGLESKLVGQGVGSQLIEELVKKSVELGAGGRLVAQASPMKSVSGKLTNLEFYYKLGFRAADDTKHKQILECIEQGKEIPLSLNVFTDIYLTQKSSEI